LSKIAFGARGAAGKLEYVDVGFGTGNGAR
jgi:hypothetical protein